MNAPVAVTRPTAVFVLLVAATAAAFWLGTDHPLSSLSPRLASGTVIAIAFAKVGFIGADFMELRHGHRVLRLVFVLWLVAFGAICSVLYVM